MPDPSSATEAAAKKIADFRFGVDDWRKHGTVYPSDLELGRLVVEAVTPHIEQAVLLEAVDSLKEQAIDAGFHSAQRWLYHLAMTAFTRRRTDG